MAEYLTCPQAARLIGISNTTLKRMCDGNLIRSVRTAGGHRRISASDVQQWIQIHGPETIKTAGAVDGLVQASPDDVAKSLLTGDHMKLLARIVKSNQEGVALSEMFDHVIAPAMWIIGKQWEDNVIDVYQEHLCTANLEELLLALRKTTTMHLQPDGVAEPDTSPVAIGCASGVDQHCVASLMIDIALRDEGWNSRSLGGTIPTENLISASRNIRPQLVWVCYTRAGDTDQMVSENQRLYAALDDGQFLAIGGQALTPSIRRRLTFDFAGDSIEHLLQFARRIRNQDSARSA